MGVHCRGGGVLRGTPRLCGGAWLRWSSSSPRGWWWRGYGVGSTRGGVPSGASPLFCFWRGYGLWVMGYVLCLTHNLCPPSRFPFPILHPSGRPSACASPRAAPRLVGGFTPSAWHCEAVRGSSQSRSQSRSQSALVATAARRQSVGQSVGRSVLLWQGGGVP